MNLYHENKIFLKNDIIILIYEYIMTQNNFFKNLYFNENFPKYVLEYLGEKIELGIPLYDIIDIIEKNNELIIENVNAYELKKFTEFMDLVNYNLESDNYVSDYCNKQELDKI